MEFRVIFSVCGTRSGIVEFRVVFFRVWNALCYCVIYIFACGTRSDIVESCVIFFRLCKALWYCGISYYIFLCVECALVLWNFCYIFLLVECALVLWNFILYFSACVTCSGIVEFHVIFVCVWNALWYCVISCYISSMCETRSGIVEFCVIFFCMWNALCYCVILCYIFPYIEISGGDNSTSLCTCVLYFSCCIFCDVLQSLHYLKQLLLPSVWNIFGQTLKTTVLSELRN